MDFAKKNIIVFGAGISGQGSVEALLELGAKVTLYDGKARELPAKLLATIEKSGGEVLFGDISHKKLQTYSAMILSPGISIKNKIVEAAMNFGIEIIGEVELAYEITPAKVLAISGTNGKTTTTTLVGAMIATLPTKSQVGGNIGLSLSKGARLLKSEQDWLVAEISSYQLESINKFRPKISAILNLTPDHLERHGSMEEYGKVKQKIFSNQTKEDYVVLNYDDPYTRKIAMNTVAQICYFSTTEEFKQGVFLKDKKIVLRWQQEYEILPISELKILGMHNVENVLAAVAMAFFAGVTIENIRMVLREFSGVVHRIEFVREVHGVKYYNDSKATNPESSIKALEAFDAEIILLAGGYDKNTDLNEFMTVVQNKVEHLILLGSAKERFAHKALELGVRKISIVGNYDEAVTLANKIATENQIILLSPACASYDMFDNFEQRGDYFKVLVQKI